MRYYSTQRPIVPGSFPKPEGNTIEQIVNFPAKTYVDEIWKQAWGYIDYEKPLSEKDACVRLIITHIRGMKRGNITMQPFFRDMVKSR